ncbi:MAG TPA: tetratricopeptide repeat protein [Polyangiaceae bacterium]|jgi:tetratricopeptide (TPR) repeat protein|nr:tetratricopeptide repeat protein [Polyangiaceae bacterium]
MLAKLLFCTAVACALLACAGSGGGNGGPGAQAPERQSEAEYDVARDLWLKRQQPREALDHALKAVELDDENAEAAHLAALIYLGFCSRGPSDCRLSEAERHARRAVQLKPDFREAKNTLAVVLIHEKRAAEAVKVLLPLTQDILYQTPENAWGNLGWAYLELGKTDEAIDALRRSIAAQPLFCVGNLRLGLAYERKSEPAPARDAFTQALETQAPGCNELQEAFAGRARASMKLGDGDAARADLEHCIGLTKNTPIGKECGAMLGKLK